MSSVDGAGDGESGRLSPTSQELKDLEGNSLDNKDGHDDAIPSGDSDFNHVEDGVEVRTSSSGLRHRHNILVRDVVNHIPEPIRTSLKPPRGSKEWIDFLLIKIPIIKWVWGYKCSYVIGDIIAGITVAIMHIPQGLAYALLANVPAIYGLYASFVPVIIYSIFGTSKHISVGTFAVVELMIGNSVDKVIASYEELTDNCIGNDSMSDEFETMEFLFRGEVTTCREVKLDIVVTLALLSGLIMFVMGLFRCGFITYFLSEPLISAYTTGAAIHVFTSQLQHITGLAEIIKVPNGVFKVPRTWVAMLTNLPSVNVATIILSVVAMIFLIIFKILNKLLKSPKVRLPVKVYKRSEGKFVTKRFPWPIPIPSQLIVVVIATIIAYYAKFEDRFSIIPVGDIPTGLPSFTVPRADFIGTLFVDAFVIAIVTYSVTVSLAKVFAREFGYNVNSDQEFLAYGMMNIIGCFFSSFPAAGSLSRSSIQASAGGKTPAVGFISSAIIFVVLLWLGGLFEHLPRAILASIVWVALYGMFKQFKDIYKFGKLCWQDGLVWVVVFGSTVLFGVDLGLGLGVMFSLLVIILRIVLPNSTILGQAHETEVFRNMDNFEEIDAIPGILAFRFRAPICFVNARVFRLRLEIACGLKGKTALKLNRNTEGCLQMLCQKTGVLHRGSYNITSQEDISAAYRVNNNSIVIRGSHDAISNVSNINHLPSIEPIHTVIIDCAPIGFMDSVGVKTLQQIVTDFDQLGVQVLFVCMTKENRDIMGKSGFFRKCSKKWLFPSMQDAVRHAQYEPILHPIASADLDVQEQEEGLEDHGNEEGLPMTSIPSNIPDIQVYPGRNSVNTGSTESLQFAQDGVNVEERQLLPSPTPSPEFDINKFIAQDI